VRGRVHLRGTTEQDGGEILRVASTMMTWLYDAFLFASLFLSPNKVIESSSASTLRRLVWTQGGRGAGDKVEDTQSIGLGETGDPHNESAIVLRRRLMFTAIQIHSMERYDSMVEGEQ